MQFDKDILISYAHIDDAPLVEGQKGWISEFHRSLEIRLAQLLGKKPKIWRDPKLQGNDYFSDEILSQLPQIALLISVLSPRYVKSEWCLKEISKFYEASSQNIGVRIKNKSRIFKIIKTPIKRDEHPETIRDLLGYEFFKLDPETGRAKELSRIFGVDNEQAYWQKLDDLAHDISDLLGSLSTEDKTSDQVEKKSIYLAETTSDVKESREIVKRELQQHGYKVLPDQVLPLVTPDFKSMTQGLLRQSILSIHIIGSSYGIVPEGTIKSIVELQNEIASELSQRENLQRLIWIPPNVKTDDQRQSDFTNLLKTDSNAQVGADLLLTSLEEVKLTILDKLKRKDEKKVDQNSFTRADAPARIYIICDQPDLENASLKLLGDYLFQQGCEVILPVFEGDETQVRVEHQENLKACTGVIICYGSGNELWLRSKLRDLIKVAGYGRTTSLQTKAVYLVEPSGIQKERFRSHEVMVVNGLQGFKEESFQEFMKDVRQELEQSNKV